MTLDDFKHMIERWWRGWLGDFASLLGIIAVVVVLFASLLAAVWPFVERANNETCAATCSAMRGKMVVRTEIGCVCDFDGKRAILTSDHGTTQVVYLPVPQ